MNTQIVCKMLLCNDMFVFHTFLANSVFWEDEGLERHSRDLGLDKEHALPTRMCLFKLEDCENDFPQTLHLCGRCFSCTCRIWIRSLSRFSKDLQNENCFCRESVFDAHDCTKDAARKLCVVPDVVKRTSAQIERSDSAKAART